jgi:uncharacterized membrane protein
MTETLDIVYTFTFLFKKRLNLAERLHFRYPVNILCTFFTPCTATLVSLGLLVQKHSKWTLSGIKIHYPSVIIRNIVNYMLEKSRKIIKYLHDHRNAHN